MSFSQVEFCYLNSKATRKKLVRALFGVPRTSLELLPYYSRMVATLATCMRDIPTMLLNMLEEEFNFLINKKVFLHIISCQNILTGLEYLIFSLSLSYVEFRLFCCPLLSQDQINIETKIKNIRFIGELCKFKIAPPGVVFTCFKVNSFLHYTFWSI